MPNVDKQVLEFIFWQLGIGVAFFGGLGGWMQWLHSIRVRNQKEAETKFLTYKNEIGESIDKLDRDLSGIVGQVRAMQQDVARNYVSWERFTETTRNIQRELDKIDRKLDNITPLRRSP